jgi:hypothetical protein
MPNAVMVSTVVWAALFVSIPYVPARMAPSQMPKTSVVAKGPVTAVPAASFVPASRNAALGFANAELGSKLRTMGIGQGNAPGHRNCPNKNAKMEKNAREEADAVGRRKVAERCELAERIIGH